jgi:hypothetical protein
MWLSAAEKANIPLGVLRSTGRVAESADARDLKSRVPLGTCGFEPRLGQLYSPIVEPCQRVASVIVLGPSNEKDRRLGLDVFSKKPLGVRRTRESRA